MSDSEKGLLDVLGEDRLRQISVKDESDGASQNGFLTNSKEIYCHCKTLILRPNHAKLVLPTDKMLMVENELRFFQQSDKLSKSIIRGCYWLVDDMYKFEQMGYTKEINAHNLKGPTSTSGDDQTASEPNQSSNLRTEALQGMRYLACAECNLCPLGWFDPGTKESYLHVRIDE